MHHRHRAGIKKGRDEVAIAGRIDAVGRDAREAETIGQKADVDVIGRAGDRAGAERHEIRFGARDVQSIDIAAEGGDVREPGMRDEHRLRPAHVRIGRHRRRCQPMPPGAPARRQAPRSSAGSPESGGAGTAGSPPTPVRCAIGPCAAAGRRRQSRATSSRSTKLWTSSSGAASKIAGFARTALWMSLKPPTIARHVGVVSTPARPSASAHATLPVMSSSTSRRSTLSDLPCSKTSLSGSPANRPDHRVDIGYRFYNSSALARRSCAPATQRPWPAVAALIPRSGLGPP